MVELPQIVGKRNANIFRCGRQRILKTSSKIKTYIYTLLCVGKLLYQNHRRSQGGGPGTRAPSIEMQVMTKILQKTLFLHFQFLFASLCTAVHAYNSN